MQVVIRDKTGESPAASALKAVVILDQFFAPSPYWLQQQQERGTPYRWSAFLAELEAYSAPGRGTPKVEHVDERTFRTPWATTVLAENERGHVIVWRTNWDSSG